MMDLDTIESVLKAGMAAAREAPGLNGGRYVGRYYDKASKTDVWVVLGHDEPDKVEERVDVVCHCAPQKCRPCGRARHWINEDGTIDREHLAR